MEVRQTTAGTLKKGSSVVFDGVACTVRSVDKAKTGKHGAKKCRIEGIGMINNDKIIKVMPASDKVDIPIIDKKPAQVLTVKDDTATVMDMESYETFDLKIPEDLKDTVAEGVQIVYWTILDDKVIKQVK